MIHTYYFTLLPVFGQLGPKTQMDSTVHPPIVHELHCLLDMTPRSDIWRIFPCVIVDSGLAKRLQDSRCSGFELRSAFFEPGDSFRNFRGNEASLPELYWCHVTGVAFKDDLALVDGSKLIVSEKVKTLIEAGKHENISFVFGDGPPTQEEIRQKLWAEAAKVAQELKARHKPESSDGGQSK
jgi:hypothetical protein